jgi:hypothetical protein
MRIRGLLSQQRVQKFVVCAWVPALESAFGQARIVPLCHRAYAANLTVAAKVIVFVGKRFCRVLILRLGLGRQPGCDQALAAGESDICAVEDDVRLAEGVFGGGAHCIVYSRLSCKQSFFLAVR